MELKKTFFISVITRTALAKLKPTNVGFWFSLEGASDDVFTKVPYQVRFMFTRERRKIKRNIERTERRKGREGKTDI